MTTDKSKMVVASIMQTLFKESFFEIIFALLQSTYSPCLLYTSGWWEASNDMVSVAVLSEQFVTDNPDVVKNTSAVDGEISGVTFSDVVPVSYTHLDVDKRQIHNLADCPCLPVCRGIEVPQRFLIKLLGA